MSVEYRDGTFSPIEDLEGAMDTFMGAIEQGTARALHVGTVNELEQVQKKKAIEDQISELTARIGKIEDGPVQSDLVVIPTRDELISVLRPGLK